MTGLDPDKHLGKTLDQMEPYLLEVRIYAIISQNIGIWIKKKKNSAMVRMVIESVSRKTQIH